MKLRLHGNSVRLRLSQAEVARLSQQGDVTEVVKFGDKAGGDLRYTLTADNADGIRAEIGPFSITVRVPRRMAEEWASSDEVGICHDDSSANDDLLTIIIEKDFKCLNPRRGEDETDLHENPNAAASCSV